MRRLALTSIPLFLLALGGGCGRFAPGEAERFDPPAAYRAWWATTEQCSGQQGSFERVRWYSVPGSSFACPTGTCVGRWEDDHTIYISEAWLDHEMVVRHEMLHDLLTYPGHPDPPFGDPCPLTWSSWTGTAARSGGRAPPPHID